MAWPRTDWSAIWVSRGSCCNQRRPMKVRTMAFNVTAMMARQPIWLIMKLMSQCHLLATISTGGAANGVKAPPIEILTKSVAITAYLNPTGRSWRRNCSRKSNAATVIAAGSVMSEPSSGINDITTRKRAVTGCRGSTRAIRSLRAPAASMSGRLAAMTMSTKTSMGSV